VATVVVAGGAGSYLVVRSLSSAGGDTSGGSIAALEIAGAPSSVTPGERVPLTARARNAAGDVVASATITWSSNDSSVAVVSPDTVLTAVAAGTATLTASSGGKSTSVTITVSPAAPIVATLKVVPAAARIAAGEAVRLAATATDASGTPVTGRRLNWSSSAPGIVAVSPVGVASGVAPGTALITATSDGSSASATVTVVGTGVASLAVLPATPRITAGQSVHLSAVARDASGKPIEVKIEGRHDPCICPRVVPVAEAMMAITLMDSWLGQRALRGRER